MKTEKSQTGSGSTPEAGKPLYVLLMMQDGEMAELSLPAVAEGRYRFEFSDNKYNNLPLYITASHNEWVAAVSGNATFQNANGSAIRRVTLCHHSIYILSHGKNTYTLYAEEERPGDNIFLPYELVNCTHISIGRMAGNDIIYGNPYISRSHAVIEQDHGRWYISDNGSTNGVYVNGKAIHHCIFNPGDSANIMGLRIIMGIGYIAVNNGAQRVSVNNNILRLITGSGEFRFSSASRANIYDAFNRLPRRRLVLTPEDIEIEGPPASMSQKMPLLLRLGSPLITGGRSIISGNIFGAVTSMLMPMLTQGFTEKDRKDYESKREHKYSEYLNYIEQQINKEKEREKTVLCDSYPSADSVLDFANNKERLWERQKQDADFLSVRIGLGNIPMKAKKNFPKERFSLESDELENRMHSIGNRRELLENAPVLLCLKEEFVCSAVGNGIQKEALLKNIIVQLAMTHSYDELKMVLLLNEDTESDIMDYVPYLPHFWNDDRSVRFVAHSREDAQQLSKELNSVWDRYNAEGGRRNQLLKTSPSFVILAESKKLYDAIEMIGAAAAADNYTNFSIVTFFENPPKECMKLITLEKHSHISDLTHPENETIEFNLDSIAMPKVANPLREVINTHLATGESGYTLPDMITFLDMYGVDSVEYLNPLRRWQDNNPVKSLAAPVGIGTDGKLFYLDLHEKKQGPHGLVAGSTGSGKSEWIITYLLSMAVNFSPDEVAFVLIDYKGGGLADAFVDKKRGIHLPHVVGTITNLDGAGISRSLVSINSELKRRQALFSKAKSETGEGTMDIYDYQRLYRQKRVSEPLPHLFIVSDEFAELKKQQPEFMDELISTARIGRSLGVHLILATQKPSGVVNEQIWSNTKFRVCLKVADKGDSYEMLKRYEAAEIKNTGRFYLQVGYNELFALGQSAWCGAPYEPGVVQEKNTDYSLKFLNETGQVILDAKPLKEKKKDVQKQIVAIVQYLSDLAKREHIIPRMLWKEPLPAKLEYAAVEAAAKENNEMQESGRICALIGMADDPERQKQYSYWIDLQSFHNMVFAAPGGAGKSTFLRTMLYSLTTRYSPEQVNYYLVDLSGGALSAFKKTPHCGAYLTEQDEAGFDRLMALMREIADRRKKLFAEAEVTSYDAYLQAGEHDGYRHMKKMPLLLFVVDSYQNIMAGFAKGTELYANFNTFMAEISAYGIRVILTISHANEISTRTKQEIDYRVILNPKDRYAAAELLPVRPSAVPPLLPGRGVCVIDDRALEFHTASVYCNLTDQEAAQQLRTDMEVLSADIPVPDIVEKLPVLSSGQTYQEFCHGIASGRIPLGYHIKDMKKISLPFRQFVSLPVFMGNPNGIRPILTNLMDAAVMNNMQVHIVRRNEESQFSSQNNLLRESPLDYKLYYCSENNITELATLLNGLVQQRNELVNEYSDLNSIPREEKGRARKASEYIYQRTRPILVLFESFGDFAGLKKSELAEAIFNAFLGNTLRGYNIYFIGCFYPEDYAAMRMNNSVARFNAADQFLMFGGRYHQQVLAASLPAEYRKKEKPNPDYDIGVLRYQENWYDIQMPCGSIESPYLNPDDAPII